MNIAKSCAGKEGCVRLGRPTASHHVNVGHVGVVEIANVTVWGLVGGGATGGKARRVGLVWIARFMPQVVVVDLTVESRVVAIPLMCDGVAWKAR